jgi:hypothetical protein
MIQQSRAMSQRLMMPPPPPRRPRSHNDSTFSNSVSEKYEDSELCCSRESRKGETQFETSDFHDSGGISTDGTDFCEDQPTLNFEDNFEINVRNTNTFPISCRRFVHAPNMPKLMEMIIRIINQSFTLEQLSADLQQVNIVLSKYFSTLISE